MGCRGSKEKKSSGYGSTTGGVRNHQSYHTVQPTSTQTQTSVPKQQPPSQPLPQPTPPQKQPVVTSSPKPAPQNARPVQKADATAILGKPFEDIKKLYTFGRELGRGQFGITYLCTENATGQTYACKSILKRKLVSKADKEDMKREIQIMQHLSGQSNIVEFKGAFEDRYSVHLVMELCAGGELFDRIIAEGHYSERAAASICRAIVNVVHICHFMGVMHRDLKPENFLLSSKDEGATLKATDFGLSVFIEEGEYFFSFHLSACLACGQFSYKLCQTLGLFICVVLVSNFCLRSKLYYIDINMLIRI